MFSRALWLPSSVPEGWQERVGLASDPSKAKKDQKRREDAFMAEWLDESDNDDENDESEETFIPQAKIESMDDDESTHEDDQEDSDESMDGVEKGQNRIRSEHFSNDEEFVDALMQDYEDDNEMEFLDRLGGIASAIGVGNKSSNELLLKEEGKDEDSEDETDRVIQKWDELFITLGSDESRENHHITLNIFDTSMRNMYAHHDLLVLDFPLCAAHLRCENLLAVGTKSEGIELFDLDFTTLHETSEPLAILGGRTDELSALISNEKGKKKKSNGNRKSDEDSVNENDSDSDDDAESAWRKAREELKDYYSNNPSLMANMPDEEKDVMFGVLKKDSHCGSVLGLDWNEQNKQRLLSVSTDSDLKQWDIEQLTCVRTIFGLHTKEVSSVMSHPCESNIVLSGSFDQSVAFFDLRCQLTVGNDATIVKEFAKDVPAKDVKRLRLNGEIESLRWYQERDGRQFIAATDDGFIQCMDVRKCFDMSDSSTIQDRCIWRWKAHSNAVTDFTVNRKFSDMIVTVSLDKTIKVWDISQPTDPKLITLQSSRMGALFSCDFGNDRFDMHSTLVMAGENDFGLWDLGRTHAMNQWLQSRVTIDSSNEDQI